MVSEKVYFLRMKIECILQMHELVDKILQEFDQKGIPPKIDEIKQFVSQNPVKASLNADLKLTLDSIKKEITSLEITGYKIKDLKKGEISWSDANTTYSWSFCENEVLEQENA